MYKLSRQPADPHCLAVGLPATFPLLLSRTQYLSSTVHYFKDFVIGIQSVTYCTVHKKKRDLGKLPVIHLKSSFVPAQSGMQPLPVSFLRSLVLLQQIRQIAVCIKGGEDDNGFGWIGGGALELGRVTQKVCCALPL